MVSLIASGVLALEGSERGEKRDSAILELESLLFA